MRDQLLTTSEIAVRLGVSRQTVTRWIREGKLQAVSIRTGEQVTYRVRPAHFAAFLARYVDEG